MLKNVNIDLILKPVAVQKCVLSELSQSNKEWQLTWEPKQMFKEKLYIKSSVSKTLSAFMSLTKWNQNTPLTYIYNIHKINMFMYF